MPFVMTQVALVTACGLQLQMVSPFRSSLNTSRRCWMLRILCASMSGGGSVFPWPNHIFFEIGSEYTWPAAMLTLQLQIQTKQRNLGTVESTQANVSL